LKWTKEKLIENLIIATIVILGVGRGGQLPTVPSNLNFQNKNKNKIF
jgi:hypothetical protein